MEIEGCQEFDLEFEDHDLIDNDQFPETMDAKKVVKSLGIDMNDHLPELHESTEPERNQRNVRYNLRKSLAWDSAFFTSAGVLDAEELSNMITGSDKKKKHVLPGIQEEISGSTESISTLQSDSLTLETLDDDLFLDIRASIQRSSKKASNLTYSSSKIAAMELDGSAISSPKKEEFVSQNKNPKPGVKKISGLQTVRMSKSQLKPTGKLASGRPIKQDSVQSQTGSIHKTGETNSVLPKPLKTISSSLPSSAAAKRDSVGTGRAKPECGSSKQGPVSCKGTQLPKVSPLGGARKVLPSSVHSTRSSTSSDNSINTSSGNAAKPSLMTARRNLVKNINISTGSSGSIPKTPSRTVPKNKLTAPTLSSYLKSTKISASVSPASSISEWSSASSTTSSVVNQRSNNLRTSIDTSSCRSVDGDNICLDPRNNLAGQKAERQGNQGVLLTSNTSKKSSTESGTLQAPVKPSGLRLPSPKIGFFDGSSSRTPNGNQRSQSSLHPVFPKNGTATSTPTRSSNGKLKSAKVPTARVATSLANIKSGSSKAAPSASSQEKSHALVKASSVLMVVNDLSISSLGVKGSGTGETCQKAVEVPAENGDKQMVDAGTGAAGKDNLGDLSLNENMSSGDIETAAGEGSYTSGSEYISQIGDSILIKKNSVPTSEAIEKENDPSNCQGEGLTEDKRGIYKKNHEPNCQLLSDTSECALFSTAAALGTAACRPPFALKNFSCSNECFDNPSELAVQVAVAGNTGFALPSSEEKENI